MQKYIACLALLFFMVPLVSGAETLTVKFGCKGRQYFRDEQGNIVTIWRVVEPGGESSRLAVNYDSHTGKINSDLTFLIAPDQSSASVLSFSNTQVKAEFEKAIPSLREPYYGSCRPTKCHESTVDTATNVVLSFSDSACQ